MSHHRFWKVVSLILLLALNCAGQRDREERNTALKQGVVAVVLKLSNIYSDVARKRYGDLSFRGWVAGTGFCVNNDGTIVTARHVIDAINIEKQAAASLGVTAEDRIGVAIESMEAGGIKMMNDMSTLPYSVLGADNDNDIAVLKAEQPTGPSMRINGKEITVAPIALALDPNRPKDQSPIFTIGFPLDEKTPITTSGTVATPWTSRNGLESSRPVDRYLLDLRVSKGNSGGPVFDARSLAVIGLIRQFDFGPTGQPDGISPGTIQAIPARYICAELDKLKIKWSKPAPIRRSVATPHRSGGRK